mgnify:CR=1 FL=1
MEESEDARKSRGGPEIDRKSILREGSKLRFQEPEIKSEPIKKRSRQSIRFQDLEKDSGNTFKLTSIPDGNISLGLKSPF